MKRDLAWNPYQKNLNWDSNRIEYPKLEISIFLSNEYVLHHFIFFHIVHNVLQWFKKEDNYNNKFSRVTNTYHISFPLVTFIFYEIPLIDIIKLRHFKTSCIIILFKKRKNNNINNNTYYGFDNLIRLLLFIQHSLVLCLSKAPDESWILILSFTIHPCELSHRFSGLQ